MQRIQTYECMCLLDNREVRKGWQPLKEAVGGMFTKHGAKIISARRWDERRLSYAIRGQQRGTYLLLYLEADTQQVAGIRRDLQFNESVLRSMLVTCDEVPQTAFEPEAAFDVSAIPTGDRAPEPQPAPAQEPAPAEPSGRAPAETETEETKA